MTSILGPYYSPTHWYAQDEDYIYRLQPAWARIHQPSAKAIATVQRLSPDTKIMLRSWDIDDHNGDRKREMYANPKDAAHKHISMWAAKLEELRVELRRNGWAYNDRQWYMGLVNEPDPSYVAQTVAYTLEAMRIAAERDWHLGVVCSSVGTFSKPSENGHGWALFKPLERPINDGGHILIAHEYWQPEGPNYGEDAGNLSWRHRSIPLDVPILIGEAGANGYIYGRYSKDDDSGWQKTVKDPKPETFAAQVKEYIEGCDSRVQGVCLYMLDYHSDQWWSFNTGPATEQLLAIKDARPQQPSPFAGSPLGAPFASPPIIQQPKTFFVSVPAGANLRTAPITGDVIIAIPFGDAVSVIGYDAVRQWAFVRWQDKAGYVLAALLSSTKPSMDAAPPVLGDGPQPVQPPPQIANKTEAWERSYAYVRRWEGGYVDNPNDKGGATNKGVTLGTYTRWRAAHGQPVPTKADLQALTDAEAKQIFYEWYWLPSGADKLAWPLCLAQIDTAVNAGVGRAQEMLAKSNGNFMAYVGHVGIWYTTLQDFQHFGRAWARRRFELLLEASQP